MSRVIVAAPPQAAPEPPPAPADPLRLVRRIGYAVLGLQLVGFLAWSTILYSRFALTSDFSIYNQAWFLIAHGHLNPFDTVQGFPFWQSHCEFVMWPLALLYWVWPHGVTLLWLQDLCVVGAEAVAFTWLCEFAQKYRPGRDAAWLGGAGLVLLAANPWIWWTVSFDYHAETLAILLTALVARDLANGRHRAWVWVVPLLACGDVAGTYLAGVGLGGVLAGRRTRRPGSLLTCLGIAATLLITLIHGNRSSGLDSSYAYLAVTASAGAPLGLTALVKGIIAHPLAVLRALWTKRLDVWANLSPSGLLGVGSPVVLPIVLVVLLANTLARGVGFAQPLFQNLAIYIFVPAGTVALLAWLARRHRRVALLLAGLAVAQTLGWTAAWGPRVPGQWLRASSPAAATLARVAARIPASAEVIASQGVVGRFAGRANVHPLYRPGPIPVSSETWFVIVPVAGIEIQSTAGAMALAGELVGSLHATLVTDANGVWAFRWRPPSSVHTITVPDGSAIVPGGSAPLPAWVAPGVAGHAVIAGPVAGWHVTSAPGEGYVVAGLAWQERPGRYQASVTLSAAGRVNVEVWNDTSGTLLARRSIPATAGIQSVTMPVDATTAHRARAYAGWGPFRVGVVQPPAGERLEVRVWSPGGGTVNVYRAELADGDRKAPGRLPAS
jgi:hypothetical protein